MRMRWLLPLFLTCFLAACASSERTDVTNVLVSPQQQRADLQRARDLGIITESEFQRELSKIGK